MSSKCRGNFHHADCTCSPPTKDTQIHFDIISSAQYWFKGNSAEVECDCHHVSFFNLPALRHWHNLEKLEIGMKKKENDPVNHPSYSTVSTSTVAEPELINHPQHYGGDTVYEVIKVLKAWGLEKDALLWTVGKYLGRAGKKEGESLLKDLKKLVWYANKRIEELENAHH